jgi:hypothetical protein
MNFNYLKPGVGNAASYQVAGIPWYTSSVAPALSTTSTVVNLPQVTKFVTIKNKSTTDDSLRITFNNESVVDNDNYFLLEAGESFSADFRVTDIHLISDNETPVPFTIVNGLTNIQRQEMTQTTPKAPNLLKWAQKQKLFVEEQLETTSDIFFGRYFRTTQDENKIFISALYEDGPAGEFRGGAIYVFENIDGEFIRTKKISPPTNIGDLTDFDFGRRLVINNDGTKIITPQGEKFYIFEQNGDSYELTQEGNFPTGVQFVSEKTFLSADEKYIFAPMAYDKRYVTNGGSVLIYASSSVGYQLAQEITASFNIDGTPKGPTVYDEFGGNIFITTDSQKLFATALGDDEAANSAGAVYIYQSSSAGYQVVQKLTASYNVDGSPETDLETDRFGISIGGTPDGNILAVGSYTDDENGFDAGAVYIFQSSSAGYQQVQKLTASFNTDGTPETSPEKDSFGYGKVSFSDDGNVLSIYAMGDEEDGGGGDYFNGSGAVYIYISSSAGYVQQDKLISLYNTDGTLETPIQSQAFGSNHELLSDGKTLLSHGRDEEFGGLYRFLYVFRYTRDY